MDAAACEVRTSEYIREERADSLKLDMLFQNSKNLTNFKGTLEYFFQENIYHYKDIMKKILCVILASFTVGCASKMPTNLYPQFSSFIAELQMCFENEHITAQLYAETRSALSYQLNTWEFDRPQMANMVNQSYQAAYVTKSTCRLTEANAYQMISNVQQHKRTQNQAEQVQKSDKNKMIFCNKIGNTTICS